MKQRILKEGEGWRLGWNPQAPEYPGLVGGNDWAIELTQAELDDFCRSLVQLAETMEQIASELMEGERIACELESDRLWLEVEGFPHAYSLRLLLQQGRRAEGNWNETAVPALLQAVKVLGVS